MAIDKLISQGGNLAVLSEDTMVALNGILPPNWSKSNPIDIREDADIQRYITAIEIASRPRRRRCHRHFTRAGKSRRNGCSSSGNRKGFKNWEAGTNRLDQEPIRLQMPASCFMKIKCRHSNSQKMP